MQIVLIATQSPFVVLNGYTLRVSGFARHLARVPGVRRVSLICPVEEHDAAIAASWAREHGVTILPFDGPVAANPTRRDGPALSARIESALSRIPPRPDDAVVVVAGPQASILLAKTPCRFARAADLMDEESPHLIGSIVGRLKKGRALRAIRELKWYRDHVSALPSLSRYAAVIVSAHDDADRLRRRGVERVNVVGNGVRVPDESGENFGAPSARREVPRLVFHGNFDFPPNEEAALLLTKAIFPLVRRESPSCQLDLVGRNPTESIARAIAGVEGINLTGEVPDLAPFLRAASLGVYPILRRTGLQSKILEAWAHGLCVITTPAVVEAFSRFSGDARLCAVAAESPEAFARSIIRLLKDQETSKSIGLSGRRLVQTRFGWPSIAREFAEVCEAVLADHVSGSPSRARTFERSEERG